jgi:MFS family permease
MLLAASVAARLPRLPVEHGLVRRPSLRGAIVSLVAPGVAWVLFWYTAVFVLLRIGFQLYQPTLLAAGEDDLRVHGLVLGGLNLVAGLAALLLVLRVHGRFGERRTATGVLLLLALSFAGLTGAVLLAIPVLFCLQQVSFAFLQPIGRTALNHRIASGDRASLLSAQSMLARLAFGAVLAVGHWDAALEARLDDTYLVLAGIALLCAVLAFLGHRGSARLETAPRG